MSPLTIRNKILLIIGGTFVTLILFLFITTQMFLMGGFERLESQNIRQNLLRFHDALKNELNSLAKEVSDWANWDDTYQFILGKDPNYITKNLPDDTLKELGLSIIYYLDTANRLVHGKVFDLQSEKEIVDNNILKEITGYKQLLVPTDNDRSVTGLIFTTKGPLLIAAHPILTSERKGPSRGTLVMGRFLNGNEIKKLSDITHLKVVINQYSQLPVDSKFRQLLSEQKKPFLIHIPDRKKIIGYALINDISGKPSLVISIAMPRTIYREGQTSIFYFIIALIGVGCVLIFMVLVLLDKIVISRLASLNNCIHEITAENDLSIRLTVTGNDELTAFTKIMNDMMDSLEQSHIELEENRQQLKDIIEFLPDATFVIDQNHKVVAWNRALEELTGVRKEDIIGKGDLEYSIPFYGKRAPMLINYVHSNLSDIRKHYQNVVQNGSVLSAEVSGAGNRIHKGKYFGINASPLFNSKGEITGAIESIRDITLQKKVEKELKYLGLHDQLTGLYNRVYFEEEIRRLEKGRLAEIGVVMCDVDGLKLVNDSLGHNAGDKLLQAAATTLQKAFRGNDVVARIGGDEFVILLPHCSEKIMESAGKRIQDAVMKYNQNNPEVPLSISVGLAFRRDNTIGLDKLIEEADNNMYHEKLHRSRSTRSAIVQTLMKTLNARDFITEGHADRMKDLVVHLSQMIGLPLSKIHDISLLAQFHDIGKVGIPDQILFKPGPLTEEEKNIMQRHSEIGFNIAKSAQELLHISDWILMHHEHWDGKGYPRGLKGEEIPIECRILAIADAYDAMISDRPYRKALTHQEALAEIRNCAGTQFDPKLVVEFVKLFENQ